MLVWTIDRMYWENHTDKRTGEQQTIGILCYCYLCGLVKDHSMPLVRFDEPKETGYPHNGICGECINKAQRAVEHRTVEAGMVHIGSPYRCSCCTQRVTPVIWFDTSSIPEQFICARCLIEAQKQILIDREDLLEQKKHLQ